MQGFYTIVFCVAWFFGMAELSQISSIDALNMPMQCDIYLAGNHNGFHCVSDDVRLVGAMFILFAFITLVISVKSKAEIIFISASFVTFTFLSASIIRVFYFFQGHAKLNFFYWSIGMLFLGSLILYLTKKISTNKTKTASQLDVDPSEMQRLELEIQERKNEAMKEKPNPSFKRDA